MKQTFDALQSLSEKVSTRKDVADRSLDKTAIGIEFSTKNLLNPKPLAEGVTILTHDPPDGDTVRLARDASDNSLRIINDATGGISAYFYRNGEAYLDLVVDSITGKQIAPDAVTNSSILSGVVTSSKLADDAVTLVKMAPGTQNQSQGTSSMRSLSNNWGGSSLSGSPGNHSHLSVNFNSEYTLEEKERSANLKSAVETMRQAPAHTQIYPLIDLVLDLAHQLLDDPGVPVQEKVRKLKEDPAYAHEVRMQYDDEYFAAWAIANDAAYAAKVQDDPRIQQMAAHAWQVYTRIEDDPVIVEDYKRRRGPFS